MISTRPSGSGASPMLARATCIVCAVAGERLRRGINILANLARDAVYVAAQHQHLAVAEEDGSMTFRFTGVPLVLVKVWPAGSKIGGSVSIHEHLPTR